MHPQHPIRQLVIAEVQHREQGLPTVVHIGNASILVEKSGRVALRSTSIHVHQKTVLLKTTRKGQVSGGMGKLLETMECFNLLKTNEGPGRLQGCAFGEGNYIPLDAPLPARREECAPCQRINCYDPEVVRQWQHSLLDELLQEQVEAVIVLAARVALKFQCPFERTINEKRNAMIMCPARCRIGSLVLNTV